MLTPYNTNKDRKVFGSALLFSESGVILQRQGAGDMDGAIQHCAYLWWHIRATRGDGGCPMGGWQGPNLENER